MKKVFFVLIPVLIIFVLSLLVVIKTLKKPIDRNTSSINLTKSPETGIISVGNSKLKVEIASSPLMWEKGLSGRLSLNKNEGMLFVFPVAQIRTFWMKDTLIPLDIIWINQGKVVGLARMFPELGVSLDRLKRYQSPSSADAVIETNLDWTKNNNIKIGDSVNY